MVLRGCMGTVGQGEGENPGIFPPLWWLLKSLDKAATIPRTDCGQGEPNCSASRNSFYVVWGCIL